MVNFLHVRKEWRWKAGFHMVGRIRLRSVQFSYPSMLAPIAFKAKGTAEVM